ncbi:DUF3137 domain-containing protein [Campylobacter ureolyticus]|uniref:DUF3137 domain-containing protein n=1 Tax=Campylobacter ureolyticus TaxID=827 RepID=UPI0022B59CB4|nr:DUF3137 domain-containing protein [Campylobacter ureolyticus]MCZ6133950.1 DUF3137 domain-containing protein [Campylobacter ureolyticus]
MEGLERKQILKKAILNYRLFFVLVPAFLFLFFLIFEIFSEYFPDIKEKYPEANLLFLAYFPLFFIELFFLNRYLNYLKKQNIKFENYIKEKLVSKFLKNYTYNPADGFGSNFINSVEIYAHYDFATHDLVKGFHKDTKFEFCIAETCENYTSVGGDFGKLINGLKKMKYELSKFTGVILGFVIDKNFKSKTIIVDKSYNTKINGKKEIFDNSTFNDEFRIFSDDAVEARYLLSFLDMEKIVNFQNTIGAGQASYAFINGKFYIFLNNYHFSYNPSLFFEVNEKDAINFAQNIKKVISFIDYFK